MDLRNDIVNAVVEAMASLCDAVALSVLEKSLMKELAQYEVQERSTDIVVHDGSAEGLLRKFIATKRVEGKSEKTLVYYGYIIRTFLVQIDKRLYELNTFDLRYYLSMYKENHGVSNRTLENMRKCLSSFFSWLNDERFIPYNPCRGLKRIKYDKVIKKPFSDEELERLKNACPTLRDLALVHFLYSTGCRVSEVVALNIDDVNFQTREIIVQGKGGKQRTVYLSEVAAMHLYNYLSARKTDNSALFCGRGGVRLQKNAIESRLKTIGAIAGVKNVHPHRFRRTLASNLIARGVDIQIVQIILGHEDIRTTQIYVYTKQHNVKYSYEKHIAA